MKIEHLINEIIDNSKWILELEEDWDDEGSCEYKRETWERACLILRNIMIDSNLQDRTTIPEISPGPNGSIDIHWKAERFELLINIPDEKDKPASFYGDNYTKDCIKGKFNWHNIPYEIITWLTNQLD